MAADVGSAGTDPIVKEGYGSSAKKPRGALAIMIASKPAPDDDGGDASSSAFASFAKAAGIPPERQAAAQAALKAYVHACMDSLSVEEKDEEY